MHGLLIGLSLCLSKKHAINGWEPRAPRMQAVDCGDSHLSLTCHYHRAARRGHGTSRLCPRIFRCVRNDSVVVALKARNCLQLRDTFHFIVTSTLSSGRKTAPGTGNSPEPIWEQTSVHTDLSQRFLGVLAAGVCDDTTSSRMYSRKKKRRVAV